MQEGDCDEDEDCKDDLVCGKNNCIKNYDFWWDASDDCCEKRKSKPRDISKIQNIVFLHINMNPKNFVLTDCYDLFQNIQICALVTSSNMLLLPRMEMKNLDHHLAPDVQVLVFSNLDVGVRVIASLRMEIGAPNVLPVQVIHHDYIIVFHMNYSNTFV